MILERLPYAREDVWKVLPQGMSIAELGVWEGAYSEYILANANPSKLYLVDIWSDSFPMTMSNTKPLENYTNVMGRYHDDDRVTVWRGDTIEFLNHIDEIDCVYIDSSHTYEQTVQELDACLGKVKKYIMGHDYIDIFGVPKAVNEFIQKHNLKCVLTNEVDEMWPSFIICVGE